MASYKTKMFSLVTRTSFLFLVLLGGQTVANAIPITLTFDDPLNYSGGTAELPNTFTESGLVFTLPNGAENHFDPFTDTDCDITGVLCWHDGAANTIVDNILTMSLVSGGTFDLVQLDFLNQRASTNLDVLSSAGDSTTISEGAGTIFNWTNITFIQFDIPGTTGSGTIPSLNNLVVSVNVPEPGAVALLFVGLAGYGLIRRRRTVCA